jgi:hypothetical protein
MVRLIAVNLRLQMVNFSLNLRKQRLLIAPSRRWRIDGRQAIIYATNSHRTVTDLLR